MFKGWYFNENFNHWHKTNGKIIAYISEFSTGYQLLIYPYGEVDFSELEIRTSDKLDSSLENLIALGNTCLKTKLANLFSEKNFWI
jgi:hypothetical protein